MATMWIAYDQSRARLPYAWTDSAASLAKIVGVSPDTIRAEASRSRNGLLKDGRYARVDFEEDEDE